VSYRDYGQGQKNAQSDGFMALELCFKLSKKKITSNNIFLNKK